MAKIHRLKTWPTPFVDMRDGCKNFEIRQNDRGYSVGDFLVLDAWNPETQRYVDDVPEVRKVTYLMRGGRFGIADGYVVMTVDKIEPFAVESAIRSLAPPRDMPLAGDSTKGGDRG